MPNRLADENSPYLLQHQNNPVDWFPWGQEALEKARAEDKPIFLSIGYAACHWCHVMEHESFEDLETAALMNEHFVNVKVDREERPDLDNIYMKAVVSLTGQGGWPMSVFLTPGGEPFYGGTYFPPERRYQMPSFRELLVGIANVWEGDRARALEAGEQLKTQLAAEFAQLPAQGGFEEKLMERISMGLAQGYDWNKGGWGQAPKFPQPMVIDFLLRRATRGDGMALDMARHALDAMGKGGMYDVVGGGFARYSVDDDWLVPHFEKMLYDNAQLGLAYLHAYLLTGEANYRRILEDTLDFIARELLDPAGGFYSSLDADSEGVEGKFYVWSQAELREILGNLAPLVESAYGVSAAGNFEGTNILRQVVSDQDLAAQFRPSPGSDQDVREQLIAAHERLLEHRNSRIWPGTDDKVLVSWNALTLLLFAEAGWHLGRTDYVDMAIRNGRFLCREMLDDHGRLSRSWRKGRARHAAYLEDYASLGLALLALYQADPDPKWFALAKQLSDTMIEHFADPTAGFFDTADDHEKLIVRPKDQQDNASPSGNSLAAHLLIRLSALSGDGSYARRAEAALLALQPLLVRYPTGFGQWLGALDMLEGPFEELAIVGTPGPERDRLTEAVRSKFRPRLVIASADPDSLPPEAPALLKDRPLLNGQASAYLCKGFACQLPVNTPEALLEQLDPPSSASD